MKILHVITKRQLRGAEIFASQLSAEFVKQGHKVFMVALQPPSIFPKVEGVTYIDLNIDKKSRFRSLKAWRSFAEIINETRPDIILANASETLKFTVFSKLLFRWRTPVAYRNANKVSDFIKSPLSKYFNWFLSRNVDHVISVSENCRVDFVRTFGITNERTTTIPIGTILSSVRYDRPQIPTTNAYWINVASLVPEKNHSGLLSIFKKYIDNRGTRDLVVVGDGRLKSFLFNTAVSLGIGDRVHFLGYRQDVDALMQHASGLLLPSLIEGLPGVVLEAMASRIPVITYDVGGIPEVIHHEITGMIVRKGDEQAFLDAMSKVESSSSLQKNLVENAYASCTNKYGINPIADRFLQLFEQIIQVS